MNILYVINIIAFADIIFFFFFFQAEDGIRDDLVTGVQTCALPISSLSDGVGPGLVINANLIMGNTAESGSGAGIAFQAANGSDMVAFPTNPLQWNTVTVTNNIIADNVGGWDGAGISLQDSVAVNIVNNTIAFN